jgi:hypothetical protein
LASRPVAPAPDRSNTSRHHELVAALLPALEQPPVQFAVRVRTAAAGRVVCGRDPGRRGPLPQGPQDGVVSVQPLLPDAVCQQPGQAPDRVSKRCALRGHALVARLHVQGRGVRGPGAPHRLPQGGRVAAHQGTHGGQRGELQPAPHHLVVTQLCTWQHGGRKTREAPKPPSLHGQAAVEFALAPPKPPALAQQTPFAFVHRKTQTRLVFFSQAIVTFY